MNATWPARIARLLAVTAATLALASCGGESIISNLSPERFVVVGDSFMDVGQNGYVYTVNDGAPTWVQDFAGYYGLTVEPSNAGGWGYAQGGARISAAGEAPSVTAQVDAVLARTTLGKNDVVLIGGGMSDVVTAVQEHGVSEAAKQAVQQAGSDLAQQVRRVVAAGATHVAVVGVPLLGDTPWARAQDQESAINRLSVNFNDALLLGIHDMGDSVLYLDAALFFDLLYDDAENYGFRNGKDAVCTTPDVTTCTTATLREEEYDRWLFADALHFTPIALRMFGSDDYTESGLARFTARW